MLIIAELDVESMKLLPITRNKINLNIYDFTFHKMKCKIFEQDDTMCYFYGTNKLVQLKIFKGDKSRFYSVNKV